MLKHAPSSTSSQWHSDLHHFHTLWLTQRRRHGHLGRSAPCCPPCGLGPRRGPARSRGVAGHRAFHRRKDGEVHHCPLLKLQKTMGKSPCFMDKATINGDFQ